jgi:hypothetical protein
MYCIQREGGTFLLIEGVVGVPVGMVRQRTVEAVQADRGQSRSTTMGVRQLGRCQARRRRSGSGVSDGGGGVKGQRHWARSRMATRCGGLGGVGCQREAEWWRRCTGQQLEEARRRALGADEWGSGDCDGGASVTATANFDNLTVDYAKSNAF